MPPKLVSPKPTAHRADRVRSVSGPIADQRPPIALRKLPIAAAGPPAPLFQVPFSSAMSDPDIALLVHTLGLTVHMLPKLSPNPNSPGAFRLDHHSGLFLERGPAEGQWVLEARTWGHPAPESVHEWHVLAAGAARLLDPGVTAPERLRAVSPEQPLRPVGRAANTRRARIGRRILGLS